uniref:Uncharacterized protein n=1 Tax=Xenopus tropicalis TaxID=8364 RepID=A0A6I8QME4_XENTR
AVSSAGRYRVCISASGKMSQKPLDFFPSLYDKSSSTPSEDIFSTWKKIWAALKEGSRCMKEAELSPPWPSGLAKISYDPLTFFSSTQCRGATPNYIDLGDISDLQFQMKEEELLKIIGEEPGPENCKKQSHLLKGLSDSLAVGIAGRAPCGGLGYAPC